MCPYFLTCLQCFCISVINKGSQGRYFVTILEVPNKIRKVLQYVWKSKLAIWEHFKPTKTSNNTLSNQDKSKTCLIFCIFFGFLDSFSGPISSKDCKFLYYLLALRWSSRILGGSSVLLGSSLHAAPSMMSHGDTRPENFAPELNIAQNGV